MRIKRRVVVDNEYTGHRRYEAVIQERTPNERGDGFDTQRKIAAMVKRQRKNEKRRRLFLEE